MRCERCPHMQAIKSALLPCQSCDQSAHHGQTHVQATDFTLAQRKMSDHTPTKGVTLLPPEIEDTLRQTMSNLFALDPVDFLLVQHIINGGSLQSFGETLQKLHKKIHFYAPSATRSMAHAKKEAIARIIPQLEPVFSALAHRQPRDDR